MPGPLKKINKIANTVIDKKFEELLLSGNWPEIEYRKKADGCESFLLIEHATKRAQFAKAIHNVVVAAGFEHGIFENARNDKYVKALQGAADTLTVQDIDKSERFGTMFG